MHFERLLDLSADLEHRSVFLFGPRQTGKTTLLRTRYSESRWYNLLQDDVFLRLSSTPGRFREELESMTPTRGPVIIDEFRSSRVSSTTSMISSNVAG